MSAVHRFDAVVVGAGGAGLMAALQLSRDPRVKTCVLSKLYPTRSHTGTAQGGIGAALGNREEDRPEWHMFDTVKGSDYLGDQDAIEVMCYEAVDVVLELEHMGLPFSRTEDGKIDQRRFGGHTHHHGQGPVRRSCYAADRTGHMILQTLYQNCVKNGVVFFDEYHVTDLLIQDGACRGVVAICVDTGALHVFHAKAVLFATGGSGRMYEITSNAHALTGDGMAVALRRGVPLEDMEFFQFHPTGIYKMGILITEGARGEGGILRNGLGERFMERYAPTLLDLAPRDILSRAIYQEIRAGRGVGGKGCVHLELMHLDPQLVHEKLPDITDFVETYLGIDPTAAPIPVQPTAHYAMGGVPTDVDGRVVVDDRKTPLVGLYAAGEVACVSVHGANRLGTNSLVDIVVFGRRAGRHMAEFCAHAEHLALPPEPEGRTREEIAALKRAGPGERPAALRKEMRAMMMELVGVYREAPGLRRAIGRIRELRGRFREARVDDRSWRFNTDLLETMELGNLLDLCLVTAESALNRQESRGGHCREDFPERDDATWLRHTLAWLEGDAVRIGYKPVSVTKFQPQPRTY